MRVQQYPGSDIVIESILDPGVNYNRYYVSYLSEGLKIYALMTVPNGEKPATGWPVVIFNHGFIPPDVYRTTERYIAYRRRRVAALRSGAAPSSHRQVLRLWTCCQCADGHVR